MNNFGRIVRVTVGRVTFSSEDLEIRFDVPFDDDTKPNESRVDIYNLSPNTLSQLKKGESASIQAGYNGDIGIIANGKVRSVVTKKDGVDKITSIFILEGDDFTRIKVTVDTADKSSIKRYREGVKKGQVVEESLSIGFKPGTKASTIINRLVGVLGIKLGGPIVLKKDVVYKKGYVVTRLILNNLEEVVRDCGSIMYHRRGNLMIRPIDVGIDENFIAESATGLIGTPSQFDEDGEKGYVVKMLLQHRVTTCSIIEVKSKSAKGKYRAIKGRHIKDKDDFYSEFKIV